MEAPVAAAPNNMASQKVNQRSGKYLTFRLGSEEFAIQVIRVREIMGLQAITAITQMPDYVKGVINLRGKAIPVVDLRLKFGLPEIEYTQRTCIIVVQVGNQSGKVMIGVVVDSVSDVLMLQPGDIENAPDFGSGFEAPYILGTAKIKNKIKILLDVDMVLTAQEMQGLGRIGGWRVG